MTTTVHEERMDSDARDVIAIINTSPDTVGLLSELLERAGFLVVTAYTHSIRDGSVDLQAFLRTHRPRVIVYDIAPPYEPNWHLFQHMAAMPVMAGRQFVITSTNARQVEGFAGPQQHVYEIVGKPFDLDQIVQATREALKIRPSR